MGSHPVSRCHERVVEDRRLGDIEPQLTARGKGPAPHESIEPSRATNTALAAVHRWQGSEVLPRAGADPTGLSGLIGEMQSRLASWSRSELVEMSMTERIEALTNCHRALHGVLECLIDLGNYWEPRAGGAFDLDAVLDWCIAVKVDLDHAFVANRSRSGVAAA